MSMVCKVSKIKVQLNEVIVSQKKERPETSQSIPVLLPAQTYVNSQQICIIPAYGLHWLPVNNIYFDPKTL